MLCGFRQNSLTTCRKLWNAFLFLERLKLDTSNLDIFNTAGTRQLTINCPSKHATWRYNKIRYRIVSSLTDRTHLCDTVVSRNPIGSISSRNCPVLMTNAIDRLYAFFSGVLCCISYSDIVKSCFVATVFFCCNWFVRRGGAVCWASDFD